MVESELALFIRGRPGDPEREVEGEGEGEWEGEGEGDEVTLEHGGGVGRRHDFDFCEVG